MPFCHPGPNCFQRKYQNAKRMNKLKIVGREFDDQKPVG